MAGGLRIADINSARPSLATTLLNYANPEETPLLDRARKGRAITQMDHKVFVTVKESRVTGGAYDGQAAGVNVGKGETRKEYQVRAQEFRREFGVGQQSQDIVEDAAVPDQFALLKLVYGKEIMKDVETRLLSDEASAPDEQLPDRGSRMSGLGDRLITTAAADYPIPAEVRIPSNQIHTEASASIDESDIVALLQARWEASGVATNFAFFVGANIQKRFDFFHDYDATVANFTSVSRDESNRATPKTLTRGLRYYRGSFGSGEVILDSFLPNQHRGYGINLDAYEIMPHGKMAKFLKLADNGSGPRGLLCFTLAAHPGDPRAHIKIVGS
jgi:hypothetical protein